MKGIQLTISGAIREQNRKDAAERAQKKRHEKQERDAKKARALPPPLPFDIP